MSDPRTSPHPIRRIMAKVILHGIPMPTAIDQEIDELLQNAKELDEHSQKQLARLDVVYNYWTKAIDGENTWACDLAQKVHRSLLDQVRSNTKYVHIANNRITELLDQKQANLDHPS